MLNIVVRGLDAFIQAMVNWSLVNWSMAIQHFNVTQYYTYAAQKCIWDRFESSRFDCRSLDVAQPACVCVEHTFYVNDVVCG